MINFKMALGKKASIRTTIRWIQMPTMITTLIMGLPPRMKRTRRQNRSFRTKEASERYTKPQIKIPHM